MDFNVNQRCRICFEDADISIWNYKVLVKLETAGSSDRYCIDAIEKSFFDLINIFSDNQEFTNLVEEFSVLCQQCMEDLKFCYITHEKMKLASIQLKNIYQESLNQCIEEEHLIEVVEESEENNFADTNVIETEADELNLVQYEFDNVEEEPTSKPITLDKNDSFIVTQFIAESLEVAENYKSTELNNDTEGIFQTSPQLFTMNLKAVEVTDIENLHAMQLPQLSSVDIAETAIYICKYCPKAFAKPEYLKTHIQKSHVCKFCTQSFHIAEDLFRHIRQVHTEYKCAICQKLLSSGTNLRHHIKRVHRINLPPKVTLIDFIKSSYLEENTAGNGMEILQELETAHIDMESKYAWQSDDCVEILSENNQ